MTDLDHLTELPVRHELTFLREMLDRDIKREGPVHSFMIRAGMLDDILAELAAARKELGELRDDNDARAVMIVELLAMLRVASGNTGFMGGVHVSRAKRMIDGLPDAIAKGEANYRAFQAACPDHEPKGTLESLATVAHMLDEYGIKQMPANENGQIDFNRAMMESAVSEIRAYLASIPPKDQADA